MTRFDARMRHVRHGRSIVGPLAQAMLLTCATGGLLLAAASPAMANPCALSGTLASLGGNDGLGGTGLGDADSGMGGTGLSGERDSGMGGTGWTGEGDSGMGGTGILGTITGFGSICVNGFEVEVDSDSTVLRGEETASYQGLALGETVLVEAEPVAAVAGASPTGPSHYARQVVVLERLRGPITRIDSAAAQLELLGVRVDLDGAMLVGPDGEAASLAGLAPGDWLSVHGHGDGPAVVATRVVALPTPSAATGRPEAIASGTALRTSDGLEVGGVAVVADDARVGVEPAVARGYWNAERGALESARVRRVRGFSRVARISLEGTIDQRVGATRVRLAGFELDVSRVPELAEPVGAASERPARIVVEGVVDGRVLRVDRAIVRPRPVRPPRVDRANIVRRLRPGREAPASEAPEMEVPSEPAGERPDQAAADRPENAAERPAGEKPDRPDRAGRRADRPDRPVRPTDLDRPTRPRRVDRPRRMRRPRPGGMGPGGGMM